MPPKVFKLYKSRCEQQPGSQSYPKASLPHKPGVIALIAIKRAENSFFHLKSFGNRYSELVEG
jgi:hypothetical protein